MGSTSKRLKRTLKSESESESEMGSEQEHGFMNQASSEEEFDGYSDEEEIGSGQDDPEEDDDNSDEYDEDDDASEDEDDGGEDEDDDDEDYGRHYGAQKDDEMEELEKEYKKYQDMEKNLIQTLKRSKDEDLIKGQAIKSQKALWDKALEIRFLLQKAFSKSNKLPQEPVRSMFCESDEGVSAAYSDLIESSRKTLDSLVQLQEALEENNPSIADVGEEGQFPASIKSSGGSDEMDVEKEKEWLQISQRQSRVAAFRNKAVDKWQRKAEVNSGVVAKKAKLLAFNQNISTQVANYMRDPSKMIKSMQARRDTIGVFGSVAPRAGNFNEEGNEEGDPELLDDSEFYQQLLKEFFDTFDPESAETATFYAMKQFQTKKRKVVDRRASKSRKIRYHVHEKIVNFMAPQPMNLPPMAPKLFENLFGLKTQKPSSAAA